MRTCPAELVVAFRNFATASTITITIMIIVVVVVFTTITD
jgi:hypothetical protein